MLLHTTSETGQPAVYINGGSIAARSIYSAQIQANAIIAEHLRAGQISSDHISTAGITADNIKGKTLSSSVPVSSGGSFINLDTGNINFAGGNLTWDNTTKTFYINASTLQIGGKNVLNTDTDLAAQINNKSTTRIQGNKLHFTNKVLMDDAFIEFLTANNIFAQKIDAREIDANRITTGTLKADFIQGGTFDGQSMIVKNITADAIKGGTFDGQSMTIKNLTADAIVAGTLDMSKFTVSNLSADDIKTGTLDISGGLRVTSGRHQIMSIDPETLDLEFNVNKMTIGGVKLITEDDQPQMEENIANELEGKLKQHLHIAYADDASGNGFSFSPLNKSYFGMYSDYNKEPSKAKEKYQWIKIEGNTGKSSKTHIAYANRKNGLLVDFSLTDSDREYLGIYSNFSEEPPSPEVYKWTKIKGEVGNPGQDAITIVLSNEAHTFVAGVTNAEAASDIIKVDAYKGTTKTSVKIGTITGTIADKITATITNNNTTNAQITINVTTALTTSSGNITIPITVDDKSFSKVYSWALSFKGNTGSAGGKGETGAPGANAKLVTLTATGQIFTKPKVGSITPSKITVTASGQNTTISTSHWQYSINGGAFTTTKPAYVTVINSTTIDVANTMSNKTLAIKVRTADAVEDTLTIARIEDGLDGSDGTDATIAFLSNESHTFAGDINNAIAATDSIEVTAYKGSTKQNVSIGTITGQVTGLTAAIASNTNNTTAPKITITVTTALKETSGTLTIPLTVNGTIYTRYYSWSVARKGATGPQGVSITKVDVEYYLSTSSTALAGGVWSTTAPAWKDGRFMWSKTVTTYTSGSPTESKPVCITGAKGSTGGAGATGRGVSSIVEQFYLSDSKTVEPPTSGWLTSPPTWSPGKYIWTRSLITYTTGTPTTSTTKPLVSSEWEAINEIQIGGRNLYPNTTNKWTEATFAGWQAYLYDIPIAEDENLKVGDEITWSGILSPAKETAGIMAHFTTNTGGYIQFQSNFISGGGVGKAIGHTVVPNNVVALKLAIRHEAGDVPSDTVRYKELKIEKGNTATDWSPAPEDVSASIKAAQDKANAASNSASDANNLLSDIASDSVLTPGEKKSTKKEWDIIVGEKPKIDASADTYSITTQKTAYNNAYNALNTYLTGSGGLLVNLNIKSAIVGTTFRNNFKNYYNARQDLLNAISNGAKSLVDNIEIGGENLFAITNTVSGYESGGNIITSSEIHRTMSNLVNIGDTKSLIYQIWNPNKRINTSNVNRVAFFTEANVHISSLAIPKVDGSTYQMFKIDVPTNARKARLGAIMGIGTIDPLIKIKFEKGNKATDWSPSPEDIEAEYTAVAQAKADAERIKAQSYADGKLSAEEKKRIADAENKYRKALILSRASSGKLMNSDPNFSKNLNEFSVYNNASNGNVSIQYEDASSSSGPSGVTRRLRVTTIGTASPHWGGIVPSKIFMSRANAEYVIRFTALLPKGRNFNYAQNAMGTGYTGEWLTSTAGTGSWEEYIYSYKCGSTGSFSSFGHLYALGGTTPTKASPLVWYLDKYEGLDISNVTGNPSQEDVDEKASAEDLTKVSNDLNTSIGDLSNTVDGKVDKSIYEEFLEHNADIQQQLSDSTVSAKENIDKALARTSIVEQKLGEGAADWIFTHTKIRMSDEGITLGEEGSGSYLQISNEQISFFNGSKEPVAFINGGMLHINHAIFVESIQISEFMFSSEISGHLTLRYVGN